MTKALIESICVEKQQDLVIAFNLERHLKRLIKSIDSFNFEYIKGVEKDHLEFFLFNQIKNHLQYKFNSVFSSADFLDTQPVKASQRQLYKLRLIYKKDACFEIECNEYKRDLNKILKIKILDFNNFHVSKDDKKWKHKFYPRAKITIPESYDEVIWLNNQKEICEGSFTNIFWRQDNEFYTPSLDCNILPGIAREIILEANKINIGNFQLSDLEKADEIFLSNSMIGLQKAVI